MGVVSLFSIGTVEQLDIIITSINTLGSVGVFYDSVPTAEMPNVEFFIARSAIDELQVTFFTDVVVDQVYGTIPFYTQPFQNPVMSFPVDINAAGGSTVFPNVLEALWTQGLIILIKLKWNIILGL